MSENMNVIPANNVETLVARYFEWHGTEKFYDLLPTWTPAQIDGMLAHFQAERARYATMAQRAFDNAAREVGKHLGLKQPGRDWRGNAIMEHMDADREQIEAYLAEHRGEESGYEYGTLARVRKAWDDFANYRIEMTDQQIHIRTLAQEYTRRGGWTRAFLVNNSNGHVHSSTSCSTCFETTQYAWLTDYSGANEEAIVADAGVRACTVCYPSAPVDVLKRETKMFTPDEIAAQQAREERAAAKAAREAATVTLEVYSTKARRQANGEWDRSLRLQEVTWKTVRALQNDTGALLRDMLGSYAMVNGFDVYVGWNAEPENFEGAWFNLNTMLEALAARGIDTQALVDRKSVV